MSLAPWRASLTGALHHNRAQPDSRYFQLATVRPDGIPANRTVVFRGFQAGTNRLTMITDKRSDKIRHLEHSPWAEACWYFTKTREQFRLAGQLHCIDATGIDATGIDATGIDPTGIDATGPAGEASRLEIWQSISDAARSQFYWPHPGRPRMESSNFAPDLVDEARPPESFCLLLLAPTSVDHLKLRGRPHNRYRYQQSSDGGWSSVEVNP
ncbi:MAG: pyridoxamine 5'-phosphate oxidase family protein [Cyanobacteria bacterium P01_F01_bin.4]